jgi:molybdopterin adenylyltransferase
MSTTLRIGVVTTSDRASRGVYQDQGTPEVLTVLQQMLATPFDAHTRLVPDERADIEAALIDLVDVAGCALVVTTGGTGPAWRDVTVEACAHVAHKHMPGFGEAMRTASLEVVPTAILSRQEAWIRHAPAQGAQAPKGTLMLNLPGSINSIRTCLLAVMPAIPYCLELLGHPRIATHDDVVKAFFPKK